MSSDEQALFRPYGFLYAPLRVFCPREQALFRALLIVIRPTPRFLQREHGFFKPVAFFIKPFSTFFQFRKHDFWFREGPETKRGFGLFFFIETSKIMVRPEKKRPLSVFFPNGREKIIIGPEKKQSTRNEKNKHLESFSPSKMRSAGFREIGIFHNCPPRPPSPRDHSMSFTDSER